MSGKMKESSLSQIKQSHACHLVLGRATRPRLLAALSLLPSPPPHYALNLYRRLPNPDLFAGNALIRCLAKSPAPAPAAALLPYRRLLRRGARPNNYTFPFLLQACARSAVPAHGRQVHAHALKMGLAGDLHVANALIHSYGCCLDIAGSRWAFDERRSPGGGGVDVVSWNSVLSGSARDGRVAACKELFDEMPERDAVSWSAMAAAYVRGGAPERSLGLLETMRGSGAAPNEAMLVTLLSAAAQLGLLGRGRAVHEAARDHLGRRPSLAISTALIDMYAKCGCIDESRSIFEGLEVKDVFAWNSMICGLATHGLAAEALSLFQSFLSSNLTPVSVTFVGVLMACSRAGLIDQGRHYFSMMKTRYKIEPEVEHYGCMVDLLSRAGLVREAIELVETMAMPVDPVIWGTMLGACMTHGLVELGEMIGNKVVEMQPDHEGHYVLLANIYARRSKWQDVVRVRRLMTARGANKVAGWSLIEAGGEVHQFVAGDRDHERCREIYEMLGEIGRRLEWVGYAPDVSSVLHDIGEEEKGHAIREHSERLAIAFGLLVTGAGETIRVVKNLRVCLDCHDVSKMISRVFEREIFVRDGSRFHLFKQGLCSCQDYW